MRRLPLHLLLLILPLAVAGHNIGTGVVALILFAQLWLERTRIAERARELWERQGGIVVTSALFVTIVMLAGALNEANGRIGLSFVFGYIIWGLLPAVVFFAQGDLDERDWARLYRTAAFVALVMGGVAAAQGLSGFKLVGTTLVPGLPRAQGFYSHPLTFAYVTLLFFPFGCVAVTRRPRDAVGWLILLGSSSAILASQSRTVQAVAALVAGYNVLRYASGRARVVMVVGGLVLGGLALGTDNPMSRKFRMTIAGGYDVRSDYPDDRVAFWRIALDMIGDKPVLGHGENLDTAYRTPYYEARGLQSFERKYEAHNMFLQAAVNGGVLGLLALVAWFVMVGRRSLELARVPGRAIGGRAALQAVVALCLAALTQNALQDSEVRYAMTLVVVALTLAGPTAISVLRGHRQDR